MSVWKGLLCTVSLSANRFYVEVLTSLLLLLCRLSQVRGCHRLKCVVDIHQISHLLIAHAQVKPYAAATARDGHFNVTTVDGRASDDVEGRAGEYGHIAIGQN